jgi:hypothetical protein
MRAALALHFAALPVDGFVDVISRHRFAPSGRGHPAAPWRQPCR